LYLKSSLSLRERVGVRGFLRFLLIFIIVPCASVAKKGVFSYKTAKKRGGVL
jgi:hypothetical protein